MSSGCPMVVDREFGDIYFVPSTSFRGPLSPFMLTFVRSWLHLGCPWGWLCALWCSRGSLWDAMRLTLCTLGFTWLPLECPWVALRRLGLLRGIVCSDIFSKKRIFNSDWLCCVSAGSTQKLTSWDSSLGIPGFWHPPPLYVRGIEMTIVYTNSLK